MVSPQSWREDRGVERDDRGLVGRNEIDKCWVVSDGSNTPVVRRQTPVWTMRWSGDGEGGMVDQGKWHRPSDGMTYGDGNGNSGRDDGMNMEKWENGGCSPFSGYG